MAKSRLETQKQAFFVCQSDSFDTKQPTCCNSSMKNPLNTEAKACKPRAFGTKEWAQRNVNCLSG